MENQDKLFKDAADKTEDKGFARMDAVWNRVEEKLDNKKQRTIAAWWKYTGMAAVFLLFIGIGFFMLTNEKNSPVVPNALPENNVTVIDTQKVKETFDAAKAVEKEAVVVNTQTVTAVSKQYAIGCTGAEPVVPEQISGTTADEAVIASDDIKSKETVVEGYRSTTKPMSIEDAAIAATPSYGANYTITGDTIFYTDGAKAIVTADNKLRVWNKRTDAGEFRVTGEITARKDEDATYFKRARFTTSKNIDDPEYYFYARKIKLVPGKKIVASTTNMSIADVPTAKSVTSVTSKTIQGRPNANFVQTLQGQTPGLQISTGSGQPGSTANADQDELYKKYYTLGGGGTDVDISDETADYAMERLEKAPSASGVVIRGIASVDNNKQPLIVMNGVIVKSSNLQGIDPNNIASVSVLKDASATSLYGNRGSNGVIIIKTKDALTEKELRKLERLNKKLEREKQKHPERFPAVEIVQPVSVPEPIDVNQEEYESFVENQFENPATAPLSTFSIDVDNASYTNIRRFLNNGQPVPKDAVRVEEMINFFKYQYPQPAGNEPFSINTEYSDAPWNSQHKLLRIGLQGKIISDDNLPASNFVFLIDVSGSMDEENKLPLLKESMKLLVQQMRNKDRIAIVVYAGAAGMVLPPTGGNDKQTIYSALDKLNAGGSTAGGQGIELAYKTAQDNFIKGGNNRVILATDGDFNVGASSDKDMQTLIEEKRKSGVFLTCLGYGMGNYKDSKMETLADKGNGNYAYIDNMQEANRYLSKEFKGSMYAIAKDVKIQIEFNPKHVQSYRLIGYENRKLRDEDFANDAIDAGELGSGHTVTALYEIIPTGIKSEYFTPAADLKYSQPAGNANQYNDELATIKFRSKKPDGDKSTEIVKVIPNNPLPLQSTSRDFKFSAAVAWFGLKLRVSQLIPNKKTDDIKALAKQGLENDPEGYRAEFIRLTDMVK